MPFTEILPVGVQRDPELWHHDTPFHALSKLNQLRKEAEDEIERLLAFLDATEGHDGDTEPNGDELDASYPESRYGPAAGMRYPHEDYEETGDDEPSLGALERPESQNQIGWGFSSFGVLDGEVNDDDLPQIDAGDEGESSTIDEEGPAWGDYDGSGQQVAVKLLRGLV